MSPLYLLYSVYIPFYKKVNYEVVTVDTAEDAVNSSVLATTVVVNPEKAKADTACDDPWTLVLAVPKLFISVHEDPFQNSVFAVLEPSFPPKHKARDVLPLAPGNCLPSFKSATSVQLDPSHVSVLAIVASPPKI